GLLLPAVGMVRNKVKDVQCINNLRQVAMIIEGYRQEHEDKFPYSLVGLVYDTSYGLPAKSLLCPFDPLKGTDPGLNRRSSWDSGTTNWSQYLGETPTSPFAPVPPAGQTQIGCSYSNEMSGAVGIGRMTPAIAALFYSSSVPDANTISWADAKLNQQLNGNFGKPFPPSKFPIIRCWWHQDWNHPVRPWETLKCNNVSLSFNVFWSSSEWEFDVNPNFQHAN
ncbi:MAG TPA: hypothetical protein DCS97_10550, partial [Planctomycetes bacterium]|nr:hypothetical protein [Planctomycetota bacterium]